MCLKSSMWLFWPERWTGPGGSIRLLRRSSTIYLYEVVTGVLRQNITELCVTTSPWDGCEYDAGSNLQRVTLRRANDRIVYKGPSAARAGDKMGKLCFKTLPGRFEWKGFQRGERILLGHRGTVQTLLALILDSPVHVRLLGQHDRSVWREGRREGQIVRSVDLLTTGGVVCHAVSHIPLGESNRPEVINDIRDGRLGLAQIVSKYRIPSQRSISAVGRYSHWFWRVYNIEGPSLSLRVFEAFPRAPFVAVGWLEQSSLQALCQSF